MWLSFSVDLKTGLLEQGPRGTGGTKNQSETTRPRSSSTPNGERCRQIHARVTQGGYGGVDGGVRAINTVVSVD